MKTGKEITKYEMQDIYNERYYNCLFEKKTAKLFINTDIKTLTANFSVFVRFNQSELFYDNMADAAQHYNSLD